jgi:hypothetical protein
MAKFRKSIKIALFFGIIFIAGCSKKAEKTQENPETSETLLKIEYGFDGDEFVIHNTMSFPLSEALISLHIYKGNAFYSEFQTMERYTIPPDEWLYISEWSLLEKGVVTDNVKFSIPEGSTIRKLYLSCNEGDIDEDFKEPD